MEWIELYSQISENFYSLEPDKQNIYGLISLLEEQFRKDGIEIHTKEFARYKEYTEHIMPLYSKWDEEDVDAVVAQTAKFFYYKGLQDGVKVKDGLFRRPLTSGA